MDEDEMDGYITYHELFRLIRRFVKNKTSEQIRTHGIRMHRKHIDNNDLLFGDGDNDTLTGRGGADSFSCGPGTDTITDFNAAEGDTKTADCENF